MNYSPFEIRKRPFTYINARSFDLCKFIDGSCGTGWSHACRFDSLGADEEKKSRETMVEAFQKAHPEIGGTSCDSYR